MSPKLLCWGLTFQHVNLGVHVQTIELSVELSLSGNKCFSRKNYLYTCLILHLKEGLFLEDEIHQYISIF
jgi:hypothetical protein